MKTLALFMVWLACALGNFIWQAIPPGHNWDKALERCYFQAVPLLIIRLGQRRRLSER